MARVATVEHLPVGSAKLFRAFLIDRLVEFLQRVFSIGSRISASRISPRPARGQEIRVAFVAASNRLML
jgi:hypothetical protein